MANVLVKFVRGDTIQLEIPQISYSNGSVYELQESDRIFIDIKAKPSDSALAIIHKEITSKDVNDSGVLTFTLYPEETATLHAGDYYFDARLVIDAENVYTIIPTSRILVYDNVTNVPKGVT